MCVWEGGGGGGGEGGGGGGTTHYNRKGGGGGLGGKSIATGLGREPVGGCYSAEMRRPAIRSTAHDPILSYPTYQPPIQDVSLQISVPNCVPLRGYTMTPYVAPRTHNKIMVSNLPGAIRNTKKSTVDTAELRQIFPLRENTLRHVVEGDGRYPRAMTPSVIESYGKAFFNHCHSHLGQGRKKVI